MNNLIEKIKEARYVFVCGNGGSAANAEHFSSDLFSKGIKVICLNSNTAIMTMIANDFGYQYVFSRQLEVFADFQDLLITISCSGTSKNIARAREAAKLLGVKVYSFETFKKDKDYGKLEDKHLQMIHQIKELL